MYKILKKTTLFVLRHSYLPLSIALLRLKVIMVKKPKAIPPPTVKKVLMINTLVGNGGAAQVAIDLALSLPTHHAHSLCLIDSGKHPRLTVDNIKHHHNSLLKKLSDANGYLDFFHSSSRKIVNHPFYQQADILHLHNLHGNYFSLFALPLLTSHKKTIWTLHDEQSLTGHCAFTLGCERWRTGCGACPHLETYPSIPKDRTAFVWKTKKEIYSKSNFVAVAPSKWLQERALASPLFKKKQVELIYNGIDEKVFYPTDRNIARTQLSLPQEKTILLFSADGGTKNSFKGGQYIEAIYQEHKNNSDLLFLNVGGKAEERPNWQSTPYISSREELALYYSAADVMIYPAVADNCPLGLLEALACGLPIITFATGGIPELVEHGKTGYVANYKDLDDFKHGLSLWLADASLRNQASISARKTVLKKFTLERMTSAYASLYQKSE